MEISRVVYSLIDAVTDLSGFPAYSTIVGILFICGLGVPIPEDVTLLSAGLLAAWQSISFPGAVAAGFIGVIGGDALLFFLGRHFGKRVFTVPGLRQLLTPERVASAEARIRKNGPFICFIARFLPGLRTPVFAMSGALGVRPATFLCLDGIAALISVPIWISVGYWLGKNFDEAFDQIFKIARRAEFIVFLAVAALCALYFAFKIFRRRAARAAAGVSMTPGIAELNHGDRVSNGDT